MFMKNLIVVQCRFNSTRLPGKALYPLTSIPMVTFLLRRLRYGLPDDQYRIVLATSMEPQDDIIDAWGAANRIPVIRGDEHNVLRRYIDCLIRYPAETVVRVTADNPLTCPNIILRLVAEKIQKNTDYVDCDNLPCGVGSDVYSGELLQLLDESVTTADEREHINLHILRHPDKFKIFHLRVSGKFARPELSMTVDTLEDWQHVSSIFETDEIEPWRISLAQAIERMDKGSV
jgi:spore coat polysaccharide biosynthesis protein SpsF